MKLAIALAAAALTFAAMPAAAQNYGYYPTYPDYYGQPQAAPYGGYAYRAPVYRQGYAYRYDRHSVARRPDHHQRYAYGRHERRDMLRSWSGRHGSSSFSRAHRW